MVRVPSILVTAFLMLSCSGEEPAAAEQDPESEPGGDAACSADAVLEQDRCVGPLHRYEPEERVDFDNVVAYGDLPTTLDLPPPPRSGFRLIVPPRRLAPGQEVQECHAWEYPALVHRNIYAARLYTTGALHHSNMYGVPLEESGRSPYPACLPGRADVFGQIDNLFSGDIMDVLFANSTQVEDGEALVFPPGMAFRITTEGREVATTIHWLNASADEVTSEVVYDFFTMPDEKVEQELVPFVFENQAFEVPPHTIGHVTTTCELSGGNIVSIMPHTHERASRFAVELLRDEENGELVYERDGFDLESDIRVYENPLSLEGARAIRHTCTIENDLNVPIVWGIGDNEMCTLFGYMYPPSAQQVGIVLGGDACLSFNIGAQRH